MATEQRQDLRVVHDRRVALAFYLQKFGRSIHNLGQLLTHQSIDEFAGIVEADVEEFGDQVLVGDRMADEPADDVQEFVFAGESAQLALADLLQFGNQSHLVAACVLDPFGEEHHPAVDIAVSIVPKVGAIRVTLTGKPV